MSRTELLRLLSVYRRSRELLIHDLVSEAPELYQPMWEYSPGSVAMRLASDKYTFLWLAEHPRIYQELYLSKSGGDFAEEEQLFTSFMKRYHHYCARFIRSGDAIPSPSPGPLDSPVAEDLLRQTIAVLEELLKVNGSADRALARLRLQRTKATKLFERQLSELRRREHGSGNP
jgi:hypothetical protein